MKKLFKLVLALTMVLSLAACSSEPEESNWCDELGGVTIKKTITYDNEDRDIIVQYEESPTIKFYFDEEEEDNYATCTLAFGELDESVLDTIEFDDYNEDGYDDIRIYFGFEPDEDNYWSLVAKYLFNPDNGQFECSEAAGIVGTPDEAYVDTWYLNGDLNQNQFMINEYGNWSTFDSTGEVLNKGFSYQLDLFIELFNYSGEYVGSIEMDNSNDSLMVMFDYNVEDYYRESDSTAK